MRLFEEIRGNVTGNEVKRKRKWVVAEKTGKGKKYFMS